MTIMTYYTPELTLVGAAKNLVLKTSELEKEAPDTCDVPELSGAGFYYQLETGW